MRGSADTGPPGRYADSTPGVDGLLASFSDLPEKRPTPRCAGQEPKGVAVTSCASVERGEGGDADTVRGYSPRLERLGLRRQTHKSARSATTRRATPPTTPPAIAPAWDLLEPEVDEAAAGELVAADELEDDCEVDVLLAEVDDDVELDDAALDAELGLEAVADGVYTM